MERLTYTPITEKFGNLSSICPYCDSIMNQRLSLARIEEINANMDMIPPKALQHIATSDVPAKMTSILLVGTQEEVAAKDQIIDCLVDNLGTVAGGFNRPFIGRADP